MKKKSKKKSNNNVFIISAVLVSCLFLTLVAVMMNVEKMGIQYGSDVEMSTAGDKAAVKDTTTLQVTTEDTTTKDNAVHKVSFIAVGDDLISDSVVHCGLQPDGSYDFTQLYRELEPEIKSADLAVINQETILGGPDFAYSGYPNFNSPYEIGDAAISAGFDVFLQATNHSYDMGVQGIENCMDYYNRHPEVTMIGLNASKEAQDEIAVIERNGIKIAMLNYTYGLNGYVLPEGSEYLVNLIDEEKIKKDLAKAEKMADFTIVFPHWGVEYTHTPIDEQVLLAKMMVENGADLIVGTHPHVLETIEWITASNGNKALCYYSLGNYTSSQDQVATMLGGMAKLTIVKQGDKVFIEDGAGIIPTVTHYIWGDNRITNTYRLKDYTEELASVHSINSVTSGFSVEALQSIAHEVVGDWIVE